MENFINSIVAKVLIPCFGKNWLAISGWLGLLFLLAVIGVISALIIIYKNSRQELAQTKGYVASTADKNRELAQSKHDLEDTLSFVKTQLEESKQIADENYNKYIEANNKLNSMTDLLAEKDKQVVSLENKVKKLESEKKAKQSETKEEVKEKSSKKKTSKKVEKTEENS